LKQSGKTWNQIADEHGEPYNAVRNRYRRYMANQKRRGNMQPPPQPSPKQDDGERVTDEASGNTREVESASPRITTLAQLIDYCKIDLDEWAIERYKIGKHDVGRKHTIKEMTWDEGKMTGSLSDSGELKIEPMWIIHVSLVRRRPEQIHPVISPVHINVNFPRPVQRSRGLKAALILPDLQTGFSREIFCGKLTPFHDRLALDVARQIAQVVEPDVSVFLGDFLDYSGWSDKFIKRPEFYFTTQAALIEGAWYAAQIRAVTRSKTYVIEGNHDLRPETQLITHMVEAYQLRSADNLTAAPVMSVDNLLGLSRNGITYVPGYPNGEVWINQTTRCIHGDKVRGQPGQTAAAIVKDANENTIFGHVHRAELATRTIPGRTGYRTVTAYSPGCLCHVDGRVPGSTRSNQWQQGAAVIWYDDEHASIVPIDIQAGRAVYQGELFQGADYLGDLRNDTKWVQF
jgi:hypothetical protein